MDSDSDCVVVNVTQSTKRTTDKPESSTKSKLSDGPGKQTKANETQRKRKSTHSTGDLPSKRSKRSDSSGNAFAANISDGSWEIVDELAYRFRVPHDVSMNVVRLLDDDNTVPFIARYRKEKTGNMDAAKLREFDEQYELLRSVKEKAANIVKKIEKGGNSNPALVSAINQARTMNDLDLINAPFKQSKTSLAQKARQLGLDEPALAILEDVARRNVRLESYVDPRKKGVSTLAEVEVGVKHIIAEQIAKDYKIIRSVNEIFSSSRLHMESKENRNLKKKLSEKKNNLREDDIYKFERYFNFRMPINFIHPHQVLALNRGENLKILSVKVDIPQGCVQTFQSNAYQTVCCARKPSSKFVEGLLRSSIQDCYDRFTEPSVSRRVRSELTQKAEKSSVEVFASNLRNLLLTAPVRGQTILAIDPGFKQGCKVAAVAPNGNPLCTQTLYLHDSHAHRASKDRDELVNIARRHNCAVIAIGNGTACRETEELVASLIKRLSFHPVNAVYCIVNESGASVYSVSQEAAAEFPDMDPNLRSAVSLARRLIEPLSEYVKVDPKHLGIGMYQHDISETLLRKTLDSVIQECVSFVGVDINTATQTVISKVAGLTANKAANIVKFRHENGAIVNREQIMLIPGIGAKTYVQCVGFLRISRRTLQSCLDSQSAKPTNLISSKQKPKSKSKKAESVNDSPNSLDSTSIHPEAYEFASRLITKCGCNINDVGTLDFIAAIANFFAQNTVEDCATKFGTGVPTMKLIADGLQQELDYDARGEFNKPLFKQGVSDLYSLKAGMVLSGKVRNSTTFGVFVDVGVGRDGLIPNRQMNHSVLNGRTLDLGDHVEVKVLDVDCNRQKLSLSLVSVERSSQAILS